tara:strand:- start:648 stop:974 length:327 start_codon:yes stop_codon:yes gene_type:complete
MTKRRWVQDSQTGELIEVTADYLPEMQADAGALWGDRHYDGLQASDGTDISSRSKQRDYMRVNNLTTADDYKDSWVQSRVKRDRLFTEGGTFSKRDIERAISQLQDRQ